MGIFFVISILATISRTAIRIRLQKKLLFDDWLLLFACFCLCAAIGLIYKSLDALYVGEEMILSPLPLEQSLRFIPQALWFEKMLDAYLCLLWTTIFAVKFSFLVFFRSLIRRVRGLTVYWAFTVGVTAVAYAFCFNLSFMSCPHFDLSARKRGPSES